VFIAILKHEEFKMSARNFYCISEEFLNHLIIFHYEIFQIFQVKDILRKKNHKVTREICEKLAIDKVNPHINLNN
jgi:hypothetical protein